MERLTETNLLSDSKHDAQATNWFNDNVLHPFENGTGVGQLYNNFVSDKNKVAPAYVPEAKVLSTDWAVHSLASAGGAVLSYAVAGKLANVGLGAISNAAGFEGTTAKILNSATTASIVGAGVFDFVKCPNAGETRLGNAAGSVAAFGVFGLGNEALAANKTIANSALLTGLGRVGVGVAGGLTSLETSHLVSKALGSKAELTWDDRINAMANGGFINVAMPIVNKGIDKAVDGVKTAMNSKPFQLPADDPVAKIATDNKAAALPQIEVQNGPRGIANLNLPEDKASAVESKARPTRPSTESEKAAELPRLILLKQQFDRNARQAQIERVAGELAGFIGEAQKTVDTAIYDFRLDPKAEDMVVGAYNKAAENGVSVRLAFFQPEEKPGSHNLIGAAEAPANFAEGGPIPQGPSADLLAKLSPKIQVQHIAMPSEAFAIPDPFTDIAGGGKPQGVILSRMVDLQNGKPGNFSNDVNTNGIRGGGHLMHDKYVVRDAGTDNAAVWTGSTNFTNDAFGSQDNNIIIMKSKAIAGAYTKDFNQMWKSGELMNTGANLHTTVKVGDGGSMTVAFSPGDGNFIDQEYARRFAEAKESVHLASMVISSPEMLKALTDDIARGVQVDGIYDGPQMDQVERNWSKSQNPASQEKLQMWQELKEHLVRKNSHPWAPDVIHDFLHDKMFVVDEKNAGTGSFNFSKNATMNAENVVIMDNMPEVASQYSSYIKDLIKTYDGKPRVETGPREKVPTTDQPTTVPPPKVELPQMTAEEAHSTFKTMVTEGKIPHGNFVDSIFKQTRPLTPKQLACVLDIIAKAQARAAKNG